MSGWYILDDAGNPKPVSALAWARWLGAASDTERIIGHRGERYGHVYTEFRGLDQQSDPDGPPLVYETVTVTPAKILRQFYATREEAVRGHAAQVLACREGAKPHFIRAGDAKNLEIVGNEFLSSQKIEASIVEPPRSFWQTVRAWMSGS